MNNGNRLYGRAGDSMPRTAVRPRTQDELEAAIADRKSRVAVFAGADVVAPVVGVVSTAEADPALDTTPVVAAAVELDAQDEQAVA